MNKHGKVAVMGNRDCTLAFRAVGLESFSAETESEAKDVLRLLTKEGYAVVFITDDIAAKIADVMETFKTRTFPAVIPIPSPTGNSGFGMQRIRHDAERALGVDILFND